MNQDELSQFELQQQFQQLGAVVKAKFTKEALLRYGTIKAADPEKAVQLIGLLAQALQRGNIQSIDDAAFKNLLARLAPPKKGFRMRR